MDSRRTGAKPQQNRSDGRGGRLASEDVIGVLLTERRRFHRFVASRVGDHAAGEDILQDCLLTALKHGDRLQRDESTVAWFYRVLRNAIADYYRGKSAENRQTGKLLAEIETGGSEPARLDDWESAVCTCFHGLLPVLKPRYAEVIRRVDLQNEAKRVVARDLKLTMATMDVLLHRARRALRDRLEILCGACSREQCRACLCLPRGRKV